MGNPKVQIKELTGIDAELIKQTKREPLFSAGAVQKKQTLLEKAKAALIKGEKVGVSDEELELVEAWLNGQILMKQICEATGKTSGQAYTLIAQCAKILWNRRIQ